MTSRRMAVRVTVLAAMLLAMGAAACGGDDDEGGGRQRRRHRPKPSRWVWSAMSAASTTSPSTVGARRAEMRRSPSSESRRERSSPALRATTCRTCRRSRGRGTTCPSASGFLLADGVNTVARSSPTELRDHRLLGDGAAVHGREEGTLDTGQRPRPDVRDEREQLPDRLHGRDARAGRRAGDLRGRRHSRSRRSTSSSPATRTAREGASPGPRS